MDTDDAIYDDPGIPTGTDRSSNVGPGNPTGPDGSSNVYLGLNADDFSPGIPMDGTSDAVEVRCVNCGANIAQRRGHNLNLGLVEVVSVIRQWIAPVAVTNGSMVCHSCWTLALNQATRNNEEPAASGSGHHRRICVSCGCSLLRARSHRLHSDTEREARIRNIIIERIMPRQLHGSDEICHPCWQRHDRLAARILVPPLQEASTIMLPNISRAPDTQSHCFYPQCAAPERLLVPDWLRVKLFTEFKYYVPASCRICSFHLRNDNWEQLTNIPNPIKTFTAEHIEDFASFVSVKNTLDFANIQDMSDDLLYYWIGISKSQFQTLVADLPNLNNTHKGTLGLVAFLIKLRTGDSDETISTLLNVPRTTLMRLMNNARDLLKQDFVPRYLGISGITRAQIASRNLLIPNDLFCADNRKPIVVMDGTYLYVQKSSNYMYQKDTYSLHKYRNLIKPFLIVCTDGYIVDVLGPYPATMSDANIVLNEFSDESKPLRQYFQSGDIFILGRGFRDCVSLLEQCNYSVHVPATLQGGEYQLSTLAANQSRTVTMCRWVVEAVNGIFKQSYKLLRQDFLI